VTGSVYLVVRLQWIFAGLQAPTLAPPEAEVYQETFAIAQSREIQFSIGTNLEVQALVAEIIQETVTIARSTGEQTTIARLLDAEATIGQSEEQTFGIAVEKEEEFER
jgi:hypothetical protein